MNLNGRRFLLAAALVAAIPHPVSAQAPEQPTNDFFWLANVGLYGVTGKSRIDIFGFAGSLDFSVMRHLSPDHAIGGSWLFMIAERVMGVPMVRYRLQFDGNQSLDIAAGTPIFGGQPAFDCDHRNCVDHQVRMAGLAKYNLSSMFGVVVRPELLRRTVRPSACFPPPFSGIPRPAGCEQFGTTGRVSVGAEIGGSPGLAIGLSVIGFALVIALAGFVAAG